LEILYTNQSHRIVIGPTNSLIGGPPNMLDVRAELQDVGQS
jgi:hypothetical protein